VAIEVTKPAERNVCHSDGAKSQERREAELPWRRRNQRNMIKRVRENTPSHILLRYVGIAGCPKAFG